MKSKLVEKSRKNVLVPMCWKCDRGLWATNLSESIPLRRLNPQVFKGCGDDDRINWANRSALCPIITRGLDKNTK